MRWVSQILLVGVALNLANLSSTTKKVPKQSDKKIFIHLMPWFESKDTSEDGLWGQHWRMKTMNPDKIIGEGNKREIASHYYPDIHPYSSGDPALIEYQILQMKYSGADGVFMDWPGTTVAWDYVKNSKSADDFINKLEGTGLDFAIVFEDHNLGLAHDAGFISDVLDQGRKDMEFLQENYFNRNNYVKIDGNPLLLTFGPQTLNSPSDWENIFSVLPQKPTFLTLWNQMEQAAGSANGEYPWIYVNFMLGLSNFYNFKDIKLKFGVAYPGFHDFFHKGGWPGLSHCQNTNCTIEHNGVKTFKMTLDLALNYTDVKWIQVATWNDYGEGTMIEPTREFGNSFLNVLQDRLGVPFGNRELELIKELYMKRKAFSGNVKIQGQLNQVFDALNNVEPDLAEKLLKSI